ncbi:MAG: hypothetical protein ACR2JB_13260 [Bryobacteraceae bacterium]
MKSRLAQEVFSIVEAEVLRRPAPVEFEMAYQVRVAIDRIRFAIKHIEQFSLNSGPGQETGFQLVDALDRLEAADRHFQSRFHSGNTPGVADKNRNAVNGSCDSGIGGKSLNEHG